MRVKLLAGVLVLGVAAADAGRAETTLDQSEEWDVTGSFEGTYVCTREAIAGLTYDESGKRWDGDGFRDTLEAQQVFRIEKARLEATRERFGPPRPVRAMAYLVSTAEIEKDLGPCAGESRETEHVFLSNSGMVRCHFAEWTYIFQASKLRYIKAYLIDHVEGEFDIAEAPYFEGGSCSKISD